MSTLTVHPIPIDEFYAAIEGPLRHIDLIFHDQNENFKLYIHKNHRYERLARLEGSVEFFGGSFGCDAPSFS